MANFSSTYSNPTIHKERIRQKFAKHLILIFTIFIALITTASYWYEPHAFIDFAGSLIALLIANFALWKFPQQYRLIIIILNLFITLFIYGSVFSGGADIHFVEIFWMIVVVLTAFFVLGKKWGIFYGVMSILLYYLYFTFFFITKENFISFIEQKNVIIITIEFIIALFFIGFIMYHFEILNQQFIRKQKEAIKNLKTEKKVIEQKNKESIILLQEIHHRVKNNLQVIISLLRMQSNSIASKEAKDGFQKSIKRLMTMSLIHQKMYENKTLVDIDLKNYIQKLVESIADSNYQEDLIDVQVFINLIYLPPEKLISTGLIINELFSITLMDNRTDKKASIKLEEQGEGYFSLTYSDNRVQEIDGKRTSLSYQLIQIFTEQLDGEFKEEKTEKGMFYYFTSLKI